MQLMGMNYVDLIIIIVDYPPMLLRNMIIPTCYRKFASNYTLVVMIDNLCNPLNFLLN
jgi:hypothetical protein